MTSKVELNSTYLPQKLANKLTTLHEMSVFSSEFEQELDDLIRLRNNAKNLVIEILAMHNEYHLEMIKEMDKPNTFFQKMPKSFQDMWKHMSKVPDFCDNIIENM